MSLNTNIDIIDNSTQLARKGADIFAMAARDCFKEKGCFIVAISGGSTPRSMHRLLAKKPYLSEIPWGETHVFWVDDRCVPGNSPDSSYGAAKKDFLDQVHIPLNHTHNMPTEVPPEDGALIYEKELKKFFRLKANKYPIFDLIFLGIGTDGHTASLFPGHEALDEKKKLVVSVKGGNPFVNRLTMTIPVLNNARRVLFLVTGKDKSNIIKSVFEQRLKKLPAQMIQPFNGELTWLMDREAASLL